MALIYKIANDINDKIYIGQTRMLLKTRISKHLYDVRNKSKLYIHRAIRKYGWKHFKVEILEDNIPLENLDDKELFYTEKFNALYPKGYVISAGKSKIISPELKKKIYKSRKGKKRSEKTKKLMSLSKIKIWSNAEFKEKRVKSLHPMAKSILCYDLEGNFIKEYSYIKDASIELNLTSSGIVNVCKGKLKKTGKYRFKYK